MLNSIRKPISIAAFALGACALGFGASLAGAQTPPEPTPAPSPSTSASASASPSAVSRTAIVSCRAASFFSWPDQTQEPSGSSYPAARQGDAFGVIGTGTLTHNGRNLTETTIDVVEPYGYGKHYWIATECIT